MPDANIHEQTGSPEKQCEAQTGAPTPPTFSFSKEDFLKFVELDLWGRFQDRLWKLVGAFLTITAIAGLFGVPYYIKSEVADRLRKDEVDFTSRRDAILAQSKAIVLMDGAYETQLLSFYAEVEQLQSSLDGLRGAKHSRTDPKESSQKKPTVDDFEWQQGSSRLLALLTKRDFSQVLASGGRGLDWPTLGLAALKERINTGKVISVTIVNPTSEAGSSFEHPVYDGTVGGALNDLMFQMIVIESLRRTIQKMESDLISYGGETDLEKRAETARVDGLLSDAYSNGFQARLTELTSSALDKSQQELFKKAMIYYIPPITQGSEQSKFHGAAQ